MSAFYEVTGPTRKQVVELLLQKYEKKYNMLEAPTIKSILEESIPLDKNDFGSWRGWVTFGLSKELVEKIEKELNLKSKND